MKSRLFWKIFLPFWILQTSIMLFLAYQVHESFGPEHPWWVQPERRAMPVLARYGTWRYSRTGADGLRELWRDIELPHRSVYWFFDDQMHELSGSFLPPPALAGVRKALDNGGLASSIEGHYLAERVNDGHGHNYVMAAVFFRPPLLERLPGSLLGVIIITSLLTSLVCTVLAQYITRPILRLRDAASAIAGGNLEARAGIAGSTRRDEIADLVRDFDTMAGEIRDLVQSNRSMLMGVSHDLRSPIARSRVALSMANSGSEAERKEMLDRIEIELLRLNGMIEQILTLARLDSGRYKPALAPVSLNEVIAEAVEDARFESSQSEGEITCSDGWPEVKLNGDANLLRSALENVLRNAIFYSGAKGHVEVALGCADGKVTVSVRDDGPGVPDDALPKLFNPFYRVDDARMASTGGNGLGLSLVAGAAKAHGGRVAARNLAPHGLEILMELPVTTINAAQP